MTTARHNLLKLICAFFVVAGVTTASSAQSIFYEFTSGPTGDGFSWPASPTGLLDADSFFTPDGVDVYNETGNSVFFDQQYQVVGNGTRINGDALWGNPTDLGAGYIGFDFTGLTGTGVQQIDFDFAWSEAGVPAVTDSIEVYLYDSDGRSSFDFLSLNDTFVGLGGSTGYEDHITLDASNYTDDDFNVDGGPFLDISYIEIYISEITFGGNNSEFAIDNLATDGAGGGGELYPSVNGGAFDVTGSSLGSNVLRGIGTYTQGVEVTNDSGVTTTFSTSLVPGGDLTDNGQVSGQLIADGVSTFNPDLVSLDRSLPSGTYESDIVVINDGDPSDPDNTVTISIDLLEAPLLTTSPDPVRVHLAEQAVLANAADPPGGLRASVKFTSGITTVGPFNLINGFDPDTPVKPGEFEQATLQFVRYGQLSGTRTGQLVASVEMTDFAGQNNDIEVFLANAEPVPNQVWNLEYLHVNATTDNANISTGASYFHILGVNTFDVAATLIGGTSSNNQNVGMQITANPDPASADLIGDAVDLIFGGGAGDLYVLQLTYEEGSLPGGATESDLELLWYNTVLGDWQSAADGNTGGTPTFFSGSYADYLTALGGGTLDAADLGAYGIDETNNHVWGILNHASLFGVGVLGGAAIPGDLDGDGFVGLADLDIILNNWNQSIPPGNPLADPTGDNFVGLADLDIVLNNWNAGTPPGPAAIPEPASVVFLTLGALGLGRRRRS